MSFNIASYAKIASAVSGRSNFIAVTKNASANDIVDAFKAGIRDFGENRLQDALPKMAAVRDALGKNYELITWHFIGHLQSNKVKNVVANFQFIQSIDTIKLAELLSAECVKQDCTIRALLEFNTSGESSKYGFQPDLAFEVANSIKDLPNLRVQGVMTVASLDDPLPCFRSAQKIFDIIKSLEVFPEFTILSMGMSQDYELALKTGANMVRIGKMIFG